MADVFVHPRGLNESETVGEGTRIWAFAHVMKGATVGRNCNICTGAFIEAGAVLGDHVTVKNGVSVWDRLTIEDGVFLGPHAVLTNDPLPRCHPEHRSPRDGWLPTTIGEGASIGANAVIVCGTAIGAFAFIGAGAVVNRDVPAHALVVGNPSRRIGWVCRCAHRLDDALRCTACARTYRRQGDGLTLAT